MRLSVNPEMHARLIGDNVVARLPRSKKSAATIGEGIMIDFRLVYSDYSYRSGMQMSERKFQHQKELNSGHTNYTLNGAAKMAAI